MVFRTSRAASGSVAGTGDEDECAGLTRVAGAAFSGLRGGLDMRKTSGSSRFVMEDWSPVDLGRQRGIVGIESGVREVGEGGGEESVGGESKVRE